MDYGNDNENELTIAYGEFITPSGVEVHKCDDLWKDLYELGERAAKRGEYDRARLLKGQARIFKSTSSDLRRNERECDGERHRQRSSGTDEQL